MPSGVDRVDELCTGQRPYHHGQPVAVLTSIGDGLRELPANPLAAAVGDRGSSSMVSVIRDHIAELRRLDDRAGGGAASLRYVRAELRAVLDVVRYSSDNPHAGRELLTATAELCRTTH